MSSLHLNERNHIVIGAERCCSLTFSTLWLANYLTKAGYLVSFCVVAPSNGGAKTIPSVPGYLMFCFQRLPEVTPKYIDIYRANIVAYFAEQFNKVFRTQPNLIISTFDRPNSWATDMAAYYGVPHNTFFSPSYLLKSRVDFAKRSKRKFYVIKPVAESSSNAGLLLDNKRAKTPTELFDILINNSGNSAFTIILNDNYLVIPALVRTSSRYCFQRTPRDDLRKLPEPIDFLRRKTAATVGYLRRRLLVAFSSQIKPPPSSSPFEQVQIRKISQSNDGSSSLATTIVTAKSIFHGQRALPMRPLLSMIESQLQETTLCSDALP